MNTLFKPRWGLLILCLALMVFNFNSASPVKAEGAQIFVSASGTGTACTQANPCEPSQGLTNAVAGDTIYFRYGPYTDVLHDPYMTITKAVSLVGGWDGAATGDVVIDPEMYVTIIDGGSARALLIINDTSGSGDLITIQGIRFQQASATTEGGAIFIQEGRVDIINCEFLNNYAGSYGGAISIESGYDVRIIGNIFDNNVVDYGGGSIYAASTDSDNTVALIEDNIFYGGDADYGSAIHNWDCRIVVNRNMFYETAGVSAIRLTSLGPVSTISNNIFIRVAQNAVESSSMPDSPHQIWNNTIVGAGNGVVLYSGTAVEVINNIFASCSYGIRYFGGTLTGSNNLFYGNTTNGGDALPNPVYEDPDFVSPATDDYHISEESPAINAGAAISLTEDYDGEFRPSGGGYDIGADEVESGMEIYIPILLK